MAVDGILQAQAAADERYFLRTRGRALDEPEAASVGAGILAAYRWQFLSGAEGRFVGVLSYYIPKSSRAATIQGM